MTRGDLTGLSAVDLAASIRDGQYSAEEVVEAFLAQIAAVDDKIEAWAFLDPDYARNQAKQADLLHVVPAGQWVHYMACRSL